MAYLAGALGALLAGGPAFVQRFWHSTPTGNAWFLVFPIGAAVCLVLARGALAELELREAAMGAPLDRLAIDGDEARERCSPWTPSPAGS